MNNYERALRDMQDKRPSAPIAWLERERELTVRQQGYGKPIPRNAEWTRV